MSAMRDRAKGRGASSRCIASAAATEHEESLLRDYVIGIGYRYVVQEWTSDQKRSPAMAGSNVL